ncbi:MAG: hypothetical protein HQL72_14680 [Magnetococcales bacterium]|nr:hypothetical protein [Magnetococcales bacterium]
MNFFRVFLLTLLATLTLSSPLYAEPTWSERMRGAWERFKTIGDRSVGTAEVVTGDRKFPVDYEALEKNSSDEADNRTQGWEKDKAARGKAMSNERSRHNRVNGEKNGKKEKKQHKNDHSKSRNNH